MGGGYRMRGKGWRRNLKPSTDRTDHNLLYRSQSTIDNRDRMFCHIALSRCTIWGIFRHFGGGGGASTFVACLRNLITDHASLSRRSNIYAPNRDTSTRGGGGG